MLNNQSCVKCGAELASFAIDGFCGACLLERGLVVSDAPSAAALETAGTHIGRYKLLQQIGMGGMGTVWMAEQTEPVRRMVALKVIKPGMDSKQILARFEAERQALALMDHPNIAKVLDAGSTTEGRPYFVMELVKGVPMTKFCDERRLSIRERLELFMPVCQAIQHAHQKGVIHRDIKPSNVLVALYDGQPVPKVIDFGIAKATGQLLTERTLFTEFGVLIGTPEYMSPEQAEFNQVDIDTRSDIYSLGVLLYELLTGTTPITREALGRAAFDEVLRRVREEEPPKPSTRLTDSKDRLASISAQRKLEPAQLRSQVRGDLDWIVMKALEKDRTRRYETANGFAMDLQRHLDNEPVAAAAPSAAYRFRKLARRNKAALGVAAAIAVILVAATVASTWQAVRATRAEEMVRKRVIEVAAERDNTVKARQEAEAISAFLTEVFQSPDPARDSRTITVAESLDRAARKLEIEFTNQPARRASLQTTLGSTYHALGLARESISLQEKVRDYYRATFGPEHPKTLEAMSSLASSYLAAGRHDDAFKLGEQVLPLSRKVYGPEHSETIKAMNNLATYFYVTGRRDEALKLEQQVLPLSRKVNGPEHPNTITAMNDLAIYYSTTGRRDEVLKLRDEVLTLSLKVNGAKHPDTLMAMNNLAASYFDVGRRNEAIKLWQDALELQRKVNGAEHPDTLTAMGNLAASYYAAGRHGEAIKMQEELLPLRRKVIGSLHPDTINAMGNLATFYSAGRRRDEAIKLLEELLTLCRKSSGPEHRDTITAMNGLALSYAAAGRTNDSLKLREEVLVIERKVCGPNHTNTTNMLTAMHNLATEYKARQRYAEAEPLAREFLQGQSKQYPSTNDAVTSAKNSLAGLLEDWAWSERGAVEKTKPAEHAREAERLLRECFDTRTQTLSSGSSRRADTLSRLGGALVAEAVTDSTLASEKRLAKFTEAEPLLLQSHDSLQKNKTATFKLKRDALNRLVRLYEAVEKLEKLDEWKQKLEAFDKAEANRQEEALKTKAGDKQPIEP